MAKILLVEDERVLADTIRYNLAREGFQVQQAMDGEEAIARFRTAQPDLVLLDLMLPKVDGFEVCRLIRRESAVPILMLTAREGEVDRVVGLEIGADDYITKPFSMRELIARVRANLRRVQMVHRGQAEEPPSVLRFGDVEVDLGRHEVRRAGRVVAMKPKEFDLLAFLAQNRGRAFSRDHLLERVWGYTAAGDTRTVDVHVRWLRQKVEPDPGRPTFIETVRGLGYRFAG
jgi:DNA-binding response OmpR family regulator